MPQSNAGRTRICREATVTRLERLPRARHTIFRDRPDLAFLAVRHFVSQVMESQPASY